jgi:hypothetical protein
MSPSGSWAGRLAMIRRRHVLSLGTTCLATWSTRLRSQGNDRNHRIAYLGTSPNSAHLENALKAALNDLGYGVNKSLPIEVRYAGDPARVAVATKELMAFRPEVLVCATDILARDALVSRSADSFAKSAELGED